MKKNLDSLLIGIENAHPEVRIHVSEAIRHVEIETVVQKNDFRLARPFSSNQDISRMWVLNSLYSVISKNGSFVIFEFKLVSEAE